MNVIMFLLTLTFCKVEKEERSYKNYIEVKVMNKSVQRKVQLKLLCMKL